MSEMHLFEKAGLGKAPFRYLGMNEKTHQACPGAPVKPGGSCEYCCSPIRFCFEVVSADGNQFHVGCECIKKLSKTSKIVTAALRDKRVFDKNRRNTSQDIRIWKACGLFLSVEKRLDSLPHPKAWAADQGKTLGDWCVWMMQNAGRTGKTDAAKVIEKAAKEIS